MKKLLLTAAAVLILCAGCATASKAAPEKSCPKEKAAAKPAVQKKAAAKPQKKAAVKAQNNKRLKVGFYVDLGSRGTGVLKLARLLYYSPQIEKLELLKGDDLVKGKLKNLDLLVMPGGSSQLQMTSMTPAGVKALQDYVRNGGSYVGICAGFHITLNRPERAQLMPYTYQADRVGFKGTPLIQLTAEGKKMLNTKLDKIFVTYSRGPVAKEALWNKGTCKTLAVYKSSVAPNNRLGKSFYGTPAMIGGTYGKGKVIATSFHPEYKLDTQDMFGDLVYAVTGVKLTPKLPQPEFKPIHVVYAGLPAMKKNTVTAIENIVEIEESNKIQLHIGATIDNLDIADVVVMPDTLAENAANYIKNSWSKLKTLMDNGRKVIVIGPVWAKAPNHKNLIRVAVGAPLVKAVLQAAKK